MAQAMAQLFFFHYEVLCTFFIGISVTVERCRGATPRAQMLATCATASDEIWAGIQRFEATRNLVPSPHTRTHTHTHIHTYLTQINATQFQYHRRIIAQRHRPHCPLQCTLQSAHNGYVYNGYRLLTDLSNKGYRLF